MRPGADLSRAAQDERPGAADIDHALSAAWQVADSGELAVAARQARLAVTAALVAGAPALSDRQRAMLDLLEGTALLQRGEHRAGLARYGSALTWFSPPETARQGAGPSAPHRLPMALARTTPAWACTALGHALGAMGDPARGLAWVACALSLAEQQGLAAARQQAQAEQGLLLALLDQYLPAIHTLQRAVSQASKTARRAVQARLLNHLAVTWIAHAQERQARQLPLAAQSALRQALATADRALLAAHTGQVAEARPEALCHRAEAQLLLGQHAAAAADLATARSDPGISRASHIEVLRVDALLLTRLGRPDAARERLGQALERAVDEVDLPARTRLLAQRLALETEHGSAQTRLPWAQQVRDHAEQCYQRRLQAAALSARLLGSADLGSTGLALDPLPTAPRPGA